MIVAMKFDDDEVNVEVLVGKRADGKIVIAFPSNPDYRRVVSRETFDKMVEDAGLTAKTKLAKTL